MLDLLDFHLNFVSGELNGYIHKKVKQAKAKANQLCSQTMKVHCIFSFSHLVTGCCPVTPCLLSSAPPPPSQWRWEYRQYSTVQTKGVGWWGSAQCCVSRNFCTQWGRRKLHPGCFRLDYCRAGTRPNFLDSITRLTCGPTSPIEDPLGFKTRW